MGFFIDVLTGSSTEAQEAQIAKLEAQVKAGTSEAEVARIRQNAADRRMGIFAKVEKPTPPPKPNRFFSFLADMGDQIGNELEIQGVGKPPPPGNIAAIVGSGLARTREVTVKTLGDTLNAGKATLEKIAQPGFLAGIAQIPKTLTALVIAIIVLVALFKFT